MGYVMKYPRRLLSLFPILSLILLLTACSSTPKPAKTIAKPAPQPAQPTAPPPAALEQPKVSQEPVVATEGAGVSVQAETGKGEEFEKDVTVLLEDAFAAYEEAQAAIEREDMDGALAKLDQAYGLLLKMSLPPDSPLLQEKNGLRILIAQRIQKISASRTTLASSVNGSIPLIENQ